MVIKYSIPEMLAIGEKVTLEQCFTPAGANQVSSTTLPHSVSDYDQASIINRNFQRDLIEFRKQLLELGHPIQVSRDYTATYESCHNCQDQQLSESVAEFFRKAQQNFYTNTAMDATRVRRLSEVEAELIGSRG